MDFDEFILYNVQMATVTFLPTIEGNRTFELELALKTKLQEVISFFHQISFLSIYAIVKGDKKAEYSFWNGRGPAGVVFQPRWIQRQTSWQRRSAVSGEYMQCCYYAGQSSNSLSCKLSISRQGHLSYIKHTRQVEKLIRYA